MYVITSTRLYENAGGTGALDERVNREKPVTVTEIKEISRYSVWYKIEGTSTVGAPISGWVRGPDLMAREGPGSELKASTASKPATEASPNAGGSNPVISTPSKSLTQPRPSDHSQKATSNQRASSPSVVRGTHRFLFVSSNNGVILKGESSEGKEYSFKRNTLIPVLDYKHTKKRRHGLLGDLVVPDEYKAVVQVASGVALPVDYRIAMKAGDDLEFNWDSANSQITGRELSSQGFKKLFHNFILKVNGSLGFVFMLLLIGVPFAMAGAFGHAVIKEVDAPLSELVMFGILAAIMILLLWFFGSLIGGWYQGYLDSYYAINSQFIAAGGIVPISISASQLPTGVGFFYYVFNIVYIPYLFFLGFLVVRFAWPAALTIHYMFVRHPAERSIKSMLRIGETDRSAIDELKRVFATEGALSTTKPDWMVRNETRQMNELGKKIDAENTVLDGLISFLRKKHIASHLKKNT